MNVELFHEYSICEHYIRRAEGTAVAFVRGIKPIPWSAVLSAINYPMRYKGVERFEVLQRVRAAIGFVPRPNPARIAMIQKFLCSGTGA